MDNLRKQVILEKLAERKRDPAYVPGTSEYKARQIRLRASRERDRVDPGSASIPTSDRHRERDRHKEISYEERNKARKTHGQTFRKFDIHRDISPISTRVGKRTISHEDSGKHFHEATKNDPIMVEAMKNRKRRAQRMGRGGYSDLIKGRTMPVTQSTPVAPPKTAPTPTKKPTLKKAK